ncbi:deltex [Fistulifera solaris]|uniref:RING-type E3 ubiquitin transferase n=1 Tax=Fistulifera solaris TaxID=1519565 RepID=A0A1Z5KKD5_FISSO|nr:deltex [Fistulifera solaris]|eukprot:GAX26585.1 deltex [Fistulifera solaris]
MDLPKDVTSPYSASSRRTGQSSDYDSSTESDEDDLKPAAIDFDEDVRLAVALQQEEFLAQERMFHKASKDETSLNCDVDELLALSLEYADDDDDEETWVAKFASLSETKYVSDDDVDEFDEKRQAQIDADAAFAKAMAETYEPLDGETRKLVEEFEKEAMFLTISGRATLFVQAVLELATKTEATLPAIMQAKIRAVNRDDMVYFAERLLKAQESLEEQGRDTSVDVGYHYTNSEECMTRIRVDGLMTLAERDAAGIPRVFNGASYGDGIYTANNPSSYSGYGPIGLLVARLKGTTTKTTGTPADQANSVIGRAGAADEILVLRNSRHCLPLIEYETALASSHKALLESLEQDLQALISKYMLVMAKSSLDQGLAKTSFPSVKIAAFNLPDNLTYTAPPMLSIDPISATTPAGSSTDECPICLATLSQSVVSLDYCGHKFHRECLLQSARAGQRSCAYCRKLFQEPQGLCPSGTLTVSYSSSQTCSGFAAGVITLDYKVPNGVQQSYHPSPGVSFSGATRQAFLPDNREGRELLKRLKYAFTRGLTFTVGTSLSSGTSNTVTWASIHHKTALSGGTHGFPDNA